MHHAAVLPATCSVSVKESAAFGICTRVPVAVFGSVLLYAAAIVIPLYFSLASVFFTVSSLPLSDLLTLWHLARVDFAIVVFGSFHVASAEFRFEQASVFFTIITPVRLEIIARIRLARVVLTIPPVLPFLAAPMGTGLAYAPVFFTALPVATFPVAVVLDTCVLQAVRSLLPFGTAVL